MKKIIIIVVAALLLGSCYNHSEIVKNDLGEYAVKAITYDANEERHVRFLGGNFNGVGHVDTAWVFPDGREFRYKTLEEAKKAQQYVDKLLRMDSIERAKLNYN